MVRSGLGILVAAIVWMATFYALTILMAASWPDYGIHGSEYINEGRFTFTPLIVAKRREAVWVLAGLLGVYLAAMHLVLYWPRFPWWYNLGVVIPAIPAVVLGGRLALMR